MHHLRGWELAAISAIAGSYAESLAVFHLVGTPNLLLRVAEDDDVGVIAVDEDRGVRTAPLGVVSGAVVGVVALLSSR
jgi:hypothetical protein